MSLRESGMLVLGSGTGQLERRASNGTDEKIFIIVKRVYVTNKIEFF